MERYNGGRFGKIKPEPACVPWVARPRPPGQTEAMTLPAGGFTCVSISAVTQRKRN
jgi:hypothetical protein